MSYCWLISVANNKKNGLPEIISPMGKGVSLLGDWRHDPTVFRDLQLPSTLLSGLPLFPANIVQPLNALTLWLHPKDREAVSAQKCES